MDEANSLSTFANNEYPAILIGPLSKALHEPDTAAFYGNPAQIIRLSQAVVHATGQRIPGSFGGKVECTEYLVAPFKGGSPAHRHSGLGRPCFFRDPVA